MADTIREDLDAAVAQFEAANPEPKPEVKPLETTPPAGDKPAPEPKGETVPPASDKVLEAKDADKPVDKPDAKPEEKPKAEEKPAVPAAPKPSEYLAPKAWKAPAKAKWDAIDPEVKAEISRREADISKSFGEHAQAREFHAQFQAAVRPFEARIRVMGLNPLQAVGELFKADYMLSSAQPQQAAGYMAKLIKDYGINVQMLDDALAGTVQADPVQAQLDMMLRQRLEPINKFLEQQQASAHQQTVAAQRDAQQTVESMAADVEKFPHFDAVRNDMADVIEMAARRSEFLTLEQAYHRAVMFNPELSAAEAARVAESRRIQQVTAGDAAARAALNASSSLQSAPSGSATRSVNQESSLREEIEAAFNSVNGR